jgi:hypothetical protein
LIEDAAQGGLEKGLHDDLIPVSPANPPIRLVAEGIDATRAVKTFAAA